MQEHELKIETLSKAIDSLVILRSQIAAQVPVNQTRIDEGMQHTGRAFSLLWDIRYQQKGGGS
jgi:hypothetical protein